MIGAAVLAVVWVQMEFGVAMNVKALWRTLVLATAASALAVDLVDSRSLGAIAGGAVVVVMSVMMRRRKWVWRLPTLYFCAAGLDYFYRVFGGMEPNTPGLLSSGAYHPLDAVVLVLCVASAAIFAVASFKREQAAA